MVWYKIIKSLTLIGLKFLYNYIDKDNDGKISLKELDKQVYEPVMKLIKRVNKRRNI